MCAVVVALVVSTELLLTRKSLRACFGALGFGVIQGGVQALVDDGAGFQNLAIAWVGLGLAAPWLFFLLRPVSARAEASTLLRP